MPIERGIAMIRKLFQSALCLLLSPLLAAQQATTVRVPKDTMIVLVSLENTSSEFAFIGAPVRFAVAKDVVIKGVTVVHAGAPVSGTITGFKRGITHHRWAGLTIQVKEIQIGQGFKLRLTQSNPVSRGKTRDYLSFVGTCAVVLPGCIAYAIAIKEGCGEDSCPHGKDSDGQQALLPSCVSEEFWVKSTATVSSSVLDEESSSAPAYPVIACSQIIDRSKIFGQPGISFVEFK
jgi:hypothetical protein